MKFGFFGGAILLMLTLVFSYIAIQNNKIAKEITLKSFGLDKPKAQALQPAVNDNNASMVQDINETKRENTPKVETKDDKWQKFDEKFKDFDKKFENF